MQWSCAWAFVFVAAVGCARATGDEPRVDRDAVEYERYRAPDKIVAGLQLAPGLRVADVGAGRGFLTTRLAAAVGASGHVVATDIDAAALAAIPRASTVETRVVAAADPGLEAGAYDRILLAEVDHYLGDRADYLRRLARALKPGGFIAVANRLPYRAPLYAAATAAGLRVTELEPAPPVHFFVKLEPVR
ncbi:MAG: class I SAM-dependent methyltransferase [Polyangia bacterium]